MITSHPNSSDSPFKYYDVTKENNNYYSAWYIMSNDLEQKHIASDDLE